MSRIYRFGAGSIADVPALADELGLERLLLVTSKRGATLAARLPVTAVFDGVRSHVPVETVRAAAALASQEAIDGLLGLGGGSAIDTCKAVILASLGDGRQLRTIAVPTTYAGAEWTPYFGVRDEVARTKEGGAHELARPAAAVYDPELTLDLSPVDTAGTAMNALAHCAEAFYASGRNDRAERDAFCGARAISHALPIVLAAPRSLYARTRLLEGAMRAAWALAESFLALGHAMAQALGGRYGLPHGVLNAICLPAALRFNQIAVPDAIAKLGEAIGSDEPIEAVEQLAGLTGFDRLRELGVAQDDLDEVAELTAARPGAKANPRPASSAEIAGLLRSVW